jgi:colanic acid biosynthesis glycosyl transferase WcaI
VKLLVISQYFWPENFRINDMVESLVARGHEVTVLTGQPNYPHGSFFPGYSFFRPRREAYGGADIIRVPLLPRGAGGGLRLALNYFSFVVFACLGVLFSLPRGRRYDAIFVFEPSPITVGIPAAFARWRFKAPVLFWVLDLWPESLAAVGAVRLPSLLAGVERLVRWIYARCDLVLVQSRAFFPRIERHGVPLERIRYFPNWGEAIFDSAHRAEPSKETVLPETGFRVLYAGNIGVAQDFPAIIAAAERLRERKDILWIVAGDGRMGQWAREEVARCGLECTVYFLGQRPLEEMPGLFAAADTLLLSLKSDNVFALTVPGKLQSYLAAGKPILAMLDGEGARIVSEAGAGYACTAGDSEALAEAVVRMAELTPAERAAMGARARDYFLDNFSRKRVFDQLEGWLNELDKQQKGKT